MALLDINLPDGSGLDLCEEIRNRGQHTYIIFITANDKESDMLKGYEVGGADYVTKPFSVTVLCKKVAAVFANLELRTPRHDLFDDGFLKSTSLNKVRPLPENPWTLHRRNTAPCSCS